MKRVTDASQFGRVAVLMGGASSEREISLISGKAVLEGLLRRGVNAFAVDGIDALIPLLVSKAVDRVFNILHGQHGGGEDGVLQGLLEAFGVPYTGSGVLASALTMDKIRTKQIWMSLGLPTPRYAKISRGDDVVQAARQVGLPVIVKPACEGSSVGVTRVFKESDLQAAVELAARYPGDMLMEQLIIGSEFSVPVLGDEALPSIRIVPKGEYYDFEAKYVAEDTQYVCPGLEDDAEQQLRELVLKAFKAVGCSGWARIDVMRDAQGNNYLLEVNTAPGMTTGHSLFPKSAAQVGISFDEVVWRVLEYSMKDNGGAHG
ncbi:MAG: D-alanine--D-alanine ligase [Steroidobacter sp.]